MGKRVVAGPGWVATGKSINRKFHHESGWLITHCGHPTALWPWAVYGPAGQLCLSGVTCRDGHAFRYAQDAIDHVELHLEGIENPAPMLAAIRANSRDPAVLALRAKLGM